ncbi:MAG TPA: hypothetical protein VMH61_05115 [Candidatus Acidoferrales bacterium]|nr:hypothetical protein [Candidatus Acidoferrales bacterium]
MKLLSDFDGVWTDPVAEARVQGVRLDEALVACVPEGGADAARAWIARARSVAAAEPGRWGWANAGRISAFGDEDAFAAHSALLHWIAAHVGEDPLAAALVAGAIAREGSLETLGVRAHLAAVASVEATRGPGVLAGAVAAGRTLLAAGAEIVVVSNSTGEKLARWFAHAGLPHTTHPRREPGALRLRGDARKHVLDPGGARPFELGGLAIDVARPHYEAILREEAPDAIVGDVVSLDLALPLWLRRHEPSWRDVRLFWLVNAETPARLRRAFAHGAPGIEPLEDGLAGVARALTR